MEKIVINLFVLLFQLFVKLVKIIFLNFFTQVLTNTKMPSARKLSFQKPMKLKRKSSLKKSSKRKTSPKRKISFSKRKVSHNKQSTIWIYYKINKKATDDWKFPLINSKLGWKIAGSGVELKKVKGKSVPHLYDIQYSGPSKHADAVWDQLKTFLEMCYNMHYITHYDMNQHEYSTK